MEERKRIVMWTTDSSLYIWQIYSNNVLFVFIKQKKSFQRSKSYLTAHTSEISMNKIIKEKWSE